MKSRISGKKKFGDSEEFKKWSGDYVPDPTEPGHPYYESHPEIFDPNYSDDEDYEREQAHKEYIEGKQSKADKLNQISAAINGAKHDAEAYGGERQGLPEDRVPIEHPDGYDSTGVSIVSEADLHNDKIKDPIYGMPPENPTARAVSGARDAHEGEAWKEAYARNATLRDIETEFKPRRKLLF